MGSTTYPYCYRIKDDCLPCENKNFVKNDDINKCVLLYSDYLGINSSNMTKNEKEDAFMKVVNCLKTYGDMYKKIGIELYVNPKTYQIYYPDNARIQANYNLFLEKIGHNKNLINENMTQDDNEKIQMFNILLNDKLREIYNQYYQSYGFSDIESLKPKEYGIARIMGPDVGGKKTRKIKRRTLKRYKNKNNNKNKNKNSKIRK